MGPIGMQEMIVIFLVALLLFGPRKLPELGKTLAKAMTEFRRAQSDLKATFQREMETIERENEALKDSTKQVAAEITGYSDFDLVGGDNHYASQFSGETVPDQNPEHHLANPAPAELPASESSPVSASEVSGAESPAESSAAPQTATSDSVPDPGLRIASAEGTVARNGVNGSSGETQHVPEAAIKS